MTEIEVRDLLARTEIERALIRKHRNLSDRALALLVGAAAETGAFRYALLSGTPLPLAEIISEAERSDVDLLIFVPREPTDAGMASAELGQSLVQRMQRARSQHGQV